MGIAYSKVPHPTWEPFGKKMFLDDWSIYSYDPVTKKDGL